MPPQHLDAGSIFKEVEEHNDFFDSLVDMIPAKLYVGNSAAAGNDQSAGLHAKYQKGQSKDSRDAKKSSLKLDKRNKFDPTQQESTRVKKRKIEEQADESDDDNFMGDIQDNHEEEDDPTPLDSLPSEKSAKGKNSPHQSRIEELRAKLKAKIDEKKNASVTNGTSNTIVSKRAARRAEKKRRVDLAKKKQAQIIVPGGKTVTGKNGLAAIKIVKDLGGSTINNDAHPNNSVVDDLAGIDFGGIAGLKDDLLKGRYTGVNKSLKNLGKKKSLERLLEEAETKKARLRELKESDDIDDKQKAKKMEWGEALKAARYVYLLNS
jgi:DNA excision repair protein ERCC-4